MEGPDGKPFRYRAAILKTWTRLGTHAAFIELTYAETVLGGRAKPARSFSPRNSLLEPWLPALFGIQATVDGPARPAMLPRAFIEIVRQYDLVLQRARFERKEPSREDWEMATKAAALILSQLG